MNGTSSLWKSLLGELSEDIIQEHCRWAESDPIDVEAVKEATIRGFSSNVSCHIRPTAWQLLLGYLTPHSQAWSDLLGAKKEIYESYLEEFVYSKLGQQSI
eukprot:Trichotokara_eunicae@DN11224_c0_g1_i1.p1